MPKRVPKSDDEKTAKLLLNSVAEVLKAHFASEPYLSKLPNDNNEVEKAMALIVMGGSGILFSFRNAFKHDDVQGMAMALRALIECKPHLKFQKPFSSI